MDDALFCTGDSKLTMWSQLVWGKKHLSTQYEIIEQIFNHLTYFDKQEVCVSAREQHVVT